MLIVKTSKEKNEKVLMKTSVKQLTRVGGRRLVLISVSKAHD